PKLAERHRCPLPLWHVRGTETHHMCCSECIDHLPVDRCPSAKRTDANPVSANDCKDLLRKVHGVPADKEKDRNAAARLDRPHFCRARGRCAPHWSNRVPGLRTLWATPAKCLLRARFRENLRDATEATPRRTLSCSRQQNNERRGEMVCLRCHTITRPA